MEVSMTVDHADAGSSPARSTNRESKMAKLEYPSEIFEGVIEALAKIARLTESPTSLVIAALDAHIAMEAFTHELKAWELLRDIEQGKRDA